MKITLVTLATLLSLLAIAVLGASPESVMFNFSSASADEQTAILVGAAPSGLSIGAKGVLMVDPSSSRRSVATSEFHLISTVSIRFLSSFQCH